MLAFVVSTRRSVLDEVNQTLNSTLLPALSLEYGRGCFVSRLRALLRSNDPLLPMKTICRICWGTAAFELSSNLKDDTQDSKSFGQAFNILTS